MLDLYAELEERERRKKRNRLQISSLAPNSPGQENRINQERERF